jgi:hypothetical protein
MVVASSGTDLDNGWTGISHNFPVPGGATLRMCLAGCDAGTNPTCMEDEAATDLVKTPTFGPPLPLLAAGVPVCVVNRFDTPNLTGGSADLATGSIRGDLHLLSGVYLTPPTQVCPRCSGDRIGATGTCDSGPRQGQACRTQSILEVAQALGDKTFTLSADCPPTGPPAGTLTITLPLTTGRSALSGPRPCGAARDNSCGSGTCTRACAGTACVATTPDGQCIDTKGGLSQVCCSGGPQTACFPTNSGEGEIVRTGRTAVPAPAWPEPTYPKAAEASLVATFCEAATGSVTVDGVSGLPGPGALVLPVVGTWLE